MLYVCDLMLGLKFLIDTSAEVVFYSLSARIKRTARFLALNRHVITQLLKHGMCSITVGLGLICTFRWIFVIVQIESPILGCDFLHYLDS